MKSLLTTKLDLKLLLKEALTLPYKIDGSEIRMANDQANGIPGWVYTSCPTILAAIEEITKFRAKKAINLMVNKVPANCVCPVHTDAVPGSPERWHLPIATSLHAFWWDEKEGLLNMVAGQWYGPMPYSILHTVGNFNKEERIHLIVDTEK